MARQFAGIMGLLAFTSVQIRGLCHDYSFTHNVWLGVVAAVLFAGGGAMVGAIAEGILGDDLRTELASRMATAQRENISKRTPTRG